MKLNKLFTVLVILSVLIMSACSSTTEKAASTPGGAQVSSAKPIELRVAWWGNAGRAKLYDEIFDMYEKQNPNVKIVREWAQLGDLITKLSTQAAGGNLPDIFGMHMLLMGGEYANKNVLEPLQPYVDKKAINLDGWDKSVIDAGKMNGQLFALPKGVVMNGIIVNNTLIKSVGMELPKEGMTMAEFKDYAKKLREKLPKDQYVISDISSGDHGLETFVRGKGKSFLSPDGKSLGFSKEDLMELWKIWDDFRKQGIAPPPQFTAENSGQPLENSAFAKRKVAMDILPTNQAKILSSYIKDDIGIVRTPSVDNFKFKSGENLQTPSWVISNKSKNKEEAVKLINWFVNDVEAQKIYNFENGIPGSKKVRDALAPTLNPLTVLAIKHFEQISPDIPPTNYRPEGSAAVFTIFTKQNEQVAFGKMTIQQAADTFFTEVEKVLKK
jgi:multiple sugar transport system substrate-binding protein